MDRMQKICSSCGGYGSIAKYKVIATDPDTKIGTAEYEEIVCEDCNGKGYTEYAVFSIEEAKAILKYCGLTT